jgi:RecA-family ATPase
MTATRKPNGDGFALLLPALDPFVPIDLYNWDHVPIPERHWLVRDWIPMAKVTGLYGPGGEGKTTLVQMLMTATALSKDWLGLPVRPVKSLGIFCEDDLEDLIIRQHDINQFYGCRFGDLVEDLMLCPRLGCDNLLMTFEGGQPKLTTFFHQVRNLALEFGAELVTIDTASDVFGGDQNNATQARQFVQYALGSIARDIKGAVVLCAHPSRSGQRGGGGDSGSVQWDAAFRSRLYFATPEQEGDEELDLDARVLTRKKSNFARRDEQIQLRWRDGVFVGKGQSTTGFVGSIERRNVEKVFLDLLDKMTDENRPVSVSSSSGNYAPKVFSRRSPAERSDYGRKDLERAMERLFSARQITNSQYGKPSDTTTRIVRTVAAK